MIVPHAAVQVTGAEALNCCVLPCGVLAETGDMIIGETTITFVVPVAPPLVAFAVTVQVAGYSPAWNSPVDDTEPQVVVHVLATLAFSWSVAFSLIVWLLGVIVTAAKLIWEEIKSRNP